MDFVLSNTLECRNGKVTGKIIPPIIDGSIKLKTLVAEASALRFTLFETMAVGDGVNDIPMLLAAGIGVAYRQTESASRHESLPKLPRPQRALLSCKILNARCVFGRVLVNSPAS